MAVWRLVKGMVVGAGLGLVVVVGVAGGGGGCGPSKHRPAEMDVSVIPGPVLEQFRRDRPNSIILDASKEDGEGGEEWRIVQYTPRADKKVTVYSADGVKLRGW